MLSTAECGHCRKRNWFAPGIIRADILVGIMKFSEEDTKAILHEHILLSPMGDSKDSAAAVVFFALPPSRWIIEEFIEVTGGQLT